MSVISMTTSDGTLGESYEQKMRKMQEMEAQLARERAELERMKMEHKSQSRMVTPDPVDIAPPMDQPRSLLSSDDFDDLRGPDTSYGENLMLPDDEFESIQQEMPAMMEPSTKTQEPKLEGPDAEIDQYRKDIEDFRSRGYNVSRMYDIFSKDIDTVRAAMLQYMQDVNQLKEIESSLGSLDASGFEHDITTLHSLLKDPDHVHDAKAYIDELSASIANREERERAGKIRDIEDLFDSVMHEFSEVTSDFEEAIGDIKVAIIDLETMAISEVHDVKKMIYDLKDNMIEAKLSHEKQGEIKGIEEDLREWARKGFNVTSIEEVLGRNLKLALNLYEEFTTRANKLLELESHLNSIPSTGFEKEINEIRGILRDTDKLLLVQNKIQSLKRRIRLAGIQMKMEKMRTPATGKRTGPTQMTCPKCGGVVPIASDERPLKVNCSSCQTEFHLKRIPSKESDKTPAPGTSPQPSSPSPSPAPGSGGASLPKPSDPSRPPSDQGGVTVTPIVVEPLSGTDQPGSGGPEKCPNCSAPLLPDSVFCGLCGHRMD